MITITKTVALALAFAFASSALAGDDHDKKRPHHGPPRVAVEACAAAVDGDDCSFEGRQGEALLGQCATDREEVLACRPEGGRRGLRRHGEDHGGKESEESD